MRHHIILRVVSKILIPFILIFGLYVQFHGEYSPGGGFQAGVIFAAGIILYALIFGLDVAHRVVPSIWVERLMPIGAVIFVGVGFICLWGGGNFLDYDYYLSFLGWGDVQSQIYGIVSVELGVGIAVASTMLVIFYKFVERGN